MNVQNTITISTIVATLFCEPKEVVRYLMICYGHLSDAANKSGLPKGQPRLSELTAEVRRS